MCANRTLFKNFFKWVHFFISTVFTCSVRGICHHREDVLQDVTEVGLVEALCRCLLCRHVLQESVQDLQTCRTPEHINTGGRTYRLPKTLHCFLINILHAEICGSQLQFFTFIFSLKNPARTFILFFTDIDLLELK